MTPSPDATQLLVQGRQGHKQAVDQLMPILHTELRDIAHRLLCKRPAGGVLDTTEVVHEAYLKLIDQSRVDWNDRTHFLALSARAMRHVLIDYYRRQQTSKRGQGRSEVTFQEGRIPVDGRGEALLAVDEVLDQLAEKDERMAQVVMYRFFGGMTHRAIAEVLDVSPRTVRRDWRKAKAWLAHELAGHGIATQTNGIRNAN